MDYNITVTPDMLIIMPVIAVILQKFKDIPILKDYTAYFPFLSIGLGIGLAFLFKVQQPVVVGLLAGLVTSGGYDALKGTPAASVTPAK